LRNTRTLAAGLLCLSFACRTSRPISDEPKVTIGVALPLSGKLAAIGEGGRDAVRLAAGELDKAESPIRIAVRDTQGEAAGAATAVEDLVLEDGAVAIVGPLTRSEATAAAEKAQSLGVPLVALTSDREVTAAGAYAFRAGLSPEDEIEALVAYAMDQLQHTRFAVFHPRIEYGERMLQLFRERVEERGGTVFAVESYAAEDTTFTKPLQHLVQRDEPWKRADFGRIVAKCKEAPDNFRKARCEREAKENVPPIIEFDALFIPDTADRIALIASAVTAEDMIVERDPKLLEKIEKTLGREVKPITLLGTSAWNSPELPKKAGRAVENAIFADVSFDAASDDATKKFVAAYRKHFKRRPEKHEALLYDATRFLRELMATGRPESTDALREKMHRAENFHGVTGEISFQSGNEARRKVKILTIENQEIREVKAP
jgi:branched-chain amino acid transport system substrate-binding protein